MKEAKKLYHIEAMSDEHILVGTDVKARNEEEAVKTMKLVFGKKETSWQPRIHKQQLSLAGRLSFESKKRHQI